MKKGQNDFFWVRFYLFERVHMSEGRGPEKENISSGPALSMEPKEPNRTTLRSPEPKSRVGYSTG